MVSELKLLPEGVKSEPFFKTEKDYQKFRQEFIEAVAPEMEKHRLARLQSERAAMFRLVD